MRTVVILRSSIQGTEIVKVITADLAFLCCKIQLLETLPLPVENKLSSHHVNSDLLQYDRSVFLRVDLPGQVWLNGFETS